MKKMMNRLNQPTPRFFQKLRNVGLSVAAIGATLLSAPVALPAVVIQIAGYLALGGSVIGAVSQTAVKNDT